MPNSDNGQNINSLHDEGIAKHSDTHHEVSILSGHWPKRNTQNVLWVNLNTQLLK